jgi:hypothetical protein
MRSRFLRSGRLLLQALDPIAKIPEYKVCAVRIALDIESVTD